jgi:hypothetical protein
MEIEDHLVHFVFIWYIFSGFDIMYKEKSGNPAAESSRIPVEPFEALSVSLSDDDKC